MIDNRHSKYLERVKNECAMTICYSIYIYIYINLELVYTCTILPKKGSSTFSLLSSPRNNVPYSIHYKQTPMPTTPTHHTEVFTEEHWAPGHDYFSPILLLVHFVAYLSLYVIQDVVCACQVCVMCCYVCCTCMHMNKHVLVALYF